ncbi:MAG TPA: nitroreductase/quinone reductase family protein [Trebonia sp.]|jgi:deazaflavin-dependent oxidoreductase (nitroreductase family)|nr:nitroreductase/quinone reductase family protein [Trebonia sp.]
MTEFRTPEVNDLNGQIIAEFRANGGKVGGPFQGSDMLLLHHTGARSGTERVSPLAFQWVGESLAVFAGIGGGLAHPGWFYNLRANPLALVEVGTQKVTVRARIAQPAERDVIYSRQKHRNPVFADYEVQAAPRRIPVVVLDPIK